MNRKSNYYDYSNLVSTDKYENMDTFFIDLSKISTEVIRSGNAAFAQEFVQSEIWQGFLESLSRIPGYLRIAYQYNCVTAYIIALGALSSYSEAGRLLEQQLHKTMRSKEDYRKGMSESIIAFTALVDREKPEISTLVPVQRACSYIADHLFVRFSLEELAAYSGCSLSYLRHIFKKEMNQSLMQYIQNKKIEMASQMLRTGRYSCSAISSQLGFCSESYFIVVFKKYTGMTPRQYKMGYRTDLADVKM